MNNQRFLFLSFKMLRQFSVVCFITLFIFPSCKQQQKVAATKSKCILDYKNAKVLTANLKLREFYFDRLNAKMSVDAFIDSSFNSFSISLRVKRDSLIWMSISKLGIEGARVLISKDSVKFFNRMENKYFKGDFTYISRLLNTPLDFEMLQSLLVGNSVAFYHEDEKIKAGVDNCQYTLGTIRKYKLRKVMEKGKELKEPAQSIYLVPQTFKISRILFYEFSPERSFDARFSEFTVLDSTQLFPLQMNYIIKAQKNVSINIHYNKPRIDEEQSFPFKIPDSYEQLVYREKQ